jgi:hypothetical protein
MEERQPWHRQKGESWMAFEAFEIYLGLGLDRSLRATGEELGKSTTLMSRWSARWRWVERTRAFEREAELEEERALLAALQEKAREAEELLRSRQPPPQPKPPVDEVDLADLSVDGLLEHLDTLVRQEARNLRERRA